MTPLYEQFYDNSYLDEDDAVEVEPVQPARTPAWVSWVIVLTVAALMLLFTWRMGVAYGAMPAPTRNVTASVRTVQRCYSGLSVQWLRSGEEPNPFIVAIFPKRGC